MQSQCDHNNTIRHGETKIGTKRRICKDCGKTFVENREIYTKTEKRLLSMLVNFLDFKSEEDFNLTDFVKFSREQYNKGSGKISIEKIYDSSRFDINKAKAVICKDGNKILVYEVKKDVLKELEKNRRATTERTRYSYKYTKEDDDNFCV